MPLLLAIGFWLIYESINVYLSNTKWKSDHTYPATEMDQMLGWVEMYGTDWMFHASNLVPMEILKESWYRQKLENHPDKDRDWVYRIYPYKAGKSYAVPRRDVWNEYWTEKCGTENYLEKYPWLKYPDNREDNGMLKEGERSSWEPVDPKLYGWKMAKVVKRN